MVTRLRFLRASVSAPSGPVVRRMEALRVIYFLQDKGRHHIKIGFTDADDSQARRRPLQTGNPSELIILFTMDGTQEDEKKLHEQFSSARECGE